MFKAVPRASGDEPLERQSYFYSRRSNQNKGMER